MTLSSMDMWRLSDELSVVDAAILMTRNDPSQKKEVWDDHLKEGYFEQVTDYPGYDATFKALKNAILSNKLAATTVFPLKRDGYSGEEADSLAAAL